MVTKTLLEVPALKRIASNDTKESKGNCTYILPATSETTDATGNSSDNTSSIIGSNTTIADNSTLTWGSNTSANNITNPNANNGSIV